MTTDALSVAVLLYTGKGYHAWPERNAERVRGAFDAKTAQAAIARVDDLLAELGALTPDWSAHTLVSASEWAGQKMRAKHPDLSDEAIDALVWTFSYGWR